MKIACFFNSPYLGGAERSFILQAYEVYCDGKRDIDFVVPYLNQTSEAKSLIKCIKDQGFSNDNISAFQFHSGLFSVSRSWPLFKIFRVLQGFTTTLISINRYSFKRHDTWWVNGNKIGFVCLILAYLTGFKGDFIWHFRDYPATSGLWRFVWLPLKLPKLFNLCLVGNSHSVSASLKEIGSSLQVKTLYNPVKKNVFKPNMENGDNTVIGVVSMMAPWKGLHDVILFSALFEEELIKLGVDTINFYGGDLYKTDGAHSHYYQDLIELKNKLNAKLVNFKGLCPPSDIFSEIDLLIHSSSRPEPFGRVILEAMSSFVPVISSGLGGAGELINHKVDGVLYDVKNMSSLYQAIHFSLGNADLLKENGFQRYNALTKDFEKQLSLIFKN